MWMWFAVLLGVLPRLRDSKVSSYLQGSGSQGVMSFVNCWRQESE